MSPEVTWNGDRFLAARLAALERNMRAAVQDAEGPVRARTPRLTGLTAADVDSTIRVEGLKVTGRVGFRKARSFVAMFAERGTSRQPARPWIRQAVLGNGRRLHQIITRGR